MSSHFGLSKHFSNGYTSHTNRSVEEVPTSFYNPGPTNGASHHLQRQSVNLDELRAGLTRRNTTSNQSAAFGFSTVGQQSRIGQERPRSGQYSFPVRFFHILSSYNFGYNPPRISTLNPALALVHPLTSVHTNGMLTTSISNCATIHPKP